MKETVDAHVTVVSMGPDSALDAIHKVLAMGERTASTHRADAAPSLTSRSVMTRGSQAHDPGVAERSGGRHPRGHAESLSRTIVWSRGNSA